MAQKNSNLHAAKTAKNDEFYTRLEDIENELKHYKSFFKGKTVYCNCDDPKESNFFKFFSMNFENYGLKKLITTGYNENGHGYLYIYEGDRNGNRMVDDNEIQVIELQENGDFRSEECIQYLKESDVVVTNPPFSCYSSDTEVLTNNGWKYIKDVDIKEDKIYSLNPKTDEIEIVKAIDFLKSPVNGNLLHFHSHNVDLMVTPNHKMYTYYKNCKNKHILKELTKAEEVKKNHLLKLTGFKWNGKKQETFTLPSVIQNEQYTRKEIRVQEKIIDMKSFLEFFGFWLADGCCRLGKNTQGNPRYCVSIKQNNSNEEYVKKLYSKIGFECKIEKRTDGNNNYVVYSKQLWEYLIQFGNSYEKYIPKDFLELDKDYLQCLFDGYINGDSHGGNGDIVLSSVSKKLIDSIQELILKLFGQISKVRKVNTVYKNKPYVYYMISLKRNLVHRSFAKYGTPDNVQYNDYVYCLTLEKNHIMLVRHNDVIGWCGNCFREYVAQLMQYEKNFLIIGNQNAISYKEVFPYIKNNQLWWGYNCVRWFKTNHITKLSKIVDNNTILTEGDRSRWFTNIPHNKRNQALDLYCKYNPTDYPCYDNYNAIEVSKVTNIPEDYDGVMGVPITFLDYWCPTQFEIVDINPHFYSIIEQGLPKPKQLTLHNVGRKDPYARILIKKLS